MFSTDLQTHSPGIYTVIGLYQVALDNFLVKKFPNGEWVGRNRKKAKLKEDSIIPLDNLDIFDDLQKLAIICYRVSQNLRDVDVIEKSQQIVDALYTNGAEEYKDIFKLDSQFDKVFMCFTEMITQHYAGHFMQDGNLNLEEILKLQYQLVNKVDSVLYDLMKVDNVKELWVKQLNLYEVQQAMPGAIANVLHNPKYSDYMDEIVAKVRQGYLKYTLDQSLTSHFYNTGSCMTADTPRLIINTLKKYYFPSAREEILSEVNSIDRCSTYIGDEGGLVLNEEEELLEEEINYSETIDFPEIVRDLVIATKHLYSRKDIRGLNIMSDLADGDVREMDLGRVYKTVLDVCKEQILRDLSERMNRAGATKSYADYKNLYTMSPVKIDKDDPNAETRLNYADNLIKKLRNDKIDSVDEFFQQYEIFYMYVQNRETGKERSTENSRKILLYSDAYKKVDKMKRLELSKEADKIYRVGTPEISRLEFKSSLERDDYIACKKKEYIETRLKEETEEYIFTFFKTIIKSVQAVNALENQLKLWNMSLASLDTNKYALMEMTKYSSLKDYILGTKRKKVAEELEVAVDYIEDLAIPCAEPIIPIEVLDRKYMGTVEISIKESRDKEKNVSEDLATQRCDDIERNLSESDNLLKDVTFPARYLVGRIFNDPHRADMCMMYMFQKYMNLYNTDRDKKFLSENIEAVCYNGTDFESIMDAHGPYERYVKNPLDEEKRLEFLRKFGPQWFMYCVYCCETMRNACLSTKEEREQNPKLMNYFVMGSRCLRYFTLQTEENGLLKCKGETRLGYEHTFSFIVQRVLSAVNNNTIEQKLNICKSFVDCSSVCLADTLDEKFERIDDNLTYAEKFYCYSTACEMVRGYVDSVSKMLESVYAGDVDKGVTVNFRSAIYKYVNIKSLDTILNFLEVVESTYTSLCNVIETDDKTGKFRIKNSVDIKDLRSLWVDKLEFVTGEMLGNGNVIYPYFQKDKTITENTDFMNRLSAYSAYYALISIIRTNRGLFERLSKTNTSISYLQDYLKDDLGMRLVHRRTGKVNLPVQELSEMIKQKVDELNSEKADEGLGDIVGVDGVPVAVVRGFTLQYDCLFYKGDNLIAETLSTGYTKVLTIYGVVSFDYKKEGRMRKIKNLEINSFKSNAIGWIVSASKQGM